MSTSFIMLLTMGVLFATGVYLMLDRSLTRVLLGFLLFGNGANMLIVLTAGAPGRPPITDGQNLSTDGMNDPLPHALVLTAIVITFAMTGFLLALIYRSWRLLRHENLEDDMADLRVSLERDSKQVAAEASEGVDQDDTEFGDEAEAPVAGALDLDDDGPRAGREAAAGEPAPTGASAPDAQRPAASPDRPAGGERS